MPAVSLVELSACPTARLGQYQKIERFQASTLRILIISDQIAAGTRQWDAESFALWHLYAVKHGYTWFLHFQVAPGRVQATGTLESESLTNVFHCLATPLEQTWKQKNNFHSKKKACLTNSPVTLGILIVAGQEADSASVYLLGLFSWDAQNSPLAIVLNTMTPCN